MTLHHAWERVPTYIGTDKSPDGNERQERACQRPGCGLIKITVIPPKQPPYPWRRWRWPGSDEFQCDGTPECRGGATAALKSQESA